METYNRRMPVYILIDCSESMVGEPLEAVGRGLQELWFDLKTNPLLIEVAYVSVITFSHEAKQIWPLTDVLSANPPDLTVGPGTCLGAALDCLTDCIARELQTGTPTQKGDWKPVVFLLTDGQPTDDWRDAFARYNEKTAPRVADFIAIACGPDAEAGLLKEISPTVLVAEAISVGQMQKLFRLVSTSVAAAGEGVGSRGLVAEGRLPEGLRFAETGGKAAAARPPSQVILSARCSTKGGAYLMRYRRDAPSGMYDAVGAYPVGADYVNAAGGSHGEEIHIATLRGSPRCPYCKRQGWMLEKNEIVCADELRVPRRRQAQVMFVLDCTGSMAEEIEGVKDSIREFIHYIESEGLGVETGLVAFRDLEQGELPEVLRFGEASFTKDARSFASRMAKLHAKGGGNNIGESCFDALVTACRQPFDKDAEKILILITDEPPLLPDGEVKTLDDVGTALSTAKIDQMHFVIPGVLEPIYKLLHRFVQGDIFPLDEKRREAASLQKVLMDVGKSITVATRIG